MELPNLQIGKTQDRVAAGNTVQITTASGGVITARAITPIKSGVVAFQKIEGRWIAFDFSVNAITSRRVELKRKRPMSIKGRELFGDYPFKGLVCFSDNNLYKGGDNNITSLTTGIPVGFANLGLSVLNFIAVWRRGDDLVIRREAVETVIEDWFLQGYSTLYGPLQGYAIEGTWRGSEFYGVNRDYIFLDVTGNDYFIDDDNIGKDWIPSIWGTHYIIEPWEGNMPSVPDPTFVGSRVGIGTGGGTEANHGFAKSLNLNTESYTPIVSCNYGILVVGERNTSETLSISFSGSVTNYIRSASGTKEGQSSDSRNWTIFLSPTDTVACSYNEVSSSVGTLNNFPGNQTATTTSDGTITSNLTHLWFSGKDCYLYTELDYSQEFSASVNHANDYGGILYGSRIEDHYWYDEFKRTMEGGLPPEVRWYVLNFTETQEASHFRPASNSILFDSLKWKNISDNSVIELDTNSIAFELFTYNLNAIEIGTEVETDCTTILAKADLYYFETPLKFSISGSATGTNREDAVSASITAEVFKDDTPSNVIWDNIITREYDIIWHEETGSYIGDVTIVEATHRTVPYPIEYINISDPRVPSFSGGYIRQLETITFRINSKRSIRAALSKQTEDGYGAIIVSRDNYLSYLINAIPLPSGAGEESDQRFPISRYTNMFIRNGRATIATTNIPTAGEIGSDRTMYAEILELLPDGRWVRREEESGDVTAMALGDPSTNPDFWSYYKE